MMKIILSLKIDQNYERNGKTEPQRWLGIISGAVMIPQPCW